MVITLQREFIYQLTAKKQFAKDDSKMTTKKLYSLFIDDERIPERGYESDVPDGVCLQYSKLEYTREHTWVICRTSSEAIEYVKRNGPPAFISFDHDLGGNDTSRKFLKWWGYEWDAAVPFPEFVVHSENCIGEVWITDFINSFNRSLE